MAAAADFDGDNITDLAIPDGSRRGIRILSFAGGKAREVARIASPGEVVTELLWVRGREKNIRVLVCGLETGQLAIMTPPGTATAGKK